ncbi:MAG: hypothetical protein WD063_03605 [Pirellulales bacterium]
MIGSSLGNCQMKSLSNASDVSSSGAAQQPGRRLVLKAIILLIVFTSLAHLPLVVSDSILWDSGPLTSAIEEGNFDLLYRVCRAGGLPQTYYLHFGLGHLPNYVHAYKLTAFASLLGATVCIFWLCLTVRCWGLVEAFAIAAIAAVYPFYSLWQELIGVPYAVCYFLFFLAACCYSRYLSDPASSKRWLALAVPLFLLSFTTQSLLVYFYALLLFFFLRQAQGYGITAAWRFCLRNALALALPVAFFLTVRWSSPSHGTYESYNQVQLTPLHLAKWLVVVPKRIALDSLRELAFVQPLFFLALAAWSTVVLVPGWWARRLPSRRLTGREFALVLGYAIGLFYMGVFPYAAVGKFPVINTYTSRHGLLAAVPIAIGLVAVLRYALRKDGVFSAGVGAVLLCCLMLQTRSYILWQNRYIKYLAIVENLKDQPDRLASFVVLQDDADFGMPEAIRSYEASWITKRAYGNERHMGFDPANFTQEYFRQMDVPAKHEYYSSREFQPSRDASWIKVERNSSLTDLGIYLGYLAAGSGKHDFLKSLVRLSVRRVEVPWEVGSASLSPTGHATLGLPGSLQRDAAALSLDAALRRLQDAHHAQAGLAVGERDLVFPDAVGEVADHGLESLGLAQMGRPHVSGAITDENALPRFLAVVDRDPTVVDLELFRRIQVVEDQALAAAPDDKMADFDGTQPIDVKRCQQISAAVQIQISHVFDTAFIMGVDGAERRQALREAAQQIVHDR